jgi:hypothetical protein
MNTKIAIQELAIVLAVRDQNPKSFNLDFLKYSGVVPQDWKLTQPAVSNAQYTQLVFPNDLHIVAQVNTITFVQPILLSDPSSLKVPELAHRFVRSLPNVEYLAVGISPKSLVTLTQAPSSYIADTFLHPHHWQQGGHSPTQANVNLTYTLDRCVFRLGIEDVRHKPANQSESPAVLVSGNFHYPLAGEMAKGGDRFTQIHQYIDNWKIDLKTYLEIVNQRFLPAKSNPAAQPGGQNTAKPDDRKAKTSGKTQAIEAASAPAKKSAVATTKSANSTR